MKLASKNSHASLPESVGGSENSCRPSAPSCPAAAPTLPSSSSSGEGGLVTAADVVVESWPGALPARARAVVELARELPPKAPEEPSGGVCSSIDERLMVSLVYDAVLCDWSGWCVAVGRVLVEGCIRKRQSGQLITLQSETRGLRRPSNYVKEMKTERNLKN